MQIIETPETYDVIVVGSGAGGGMASRILAESGLNVAVVEAGPTFDPKNDEHRTQLKRAPGNHPEEALDRSGLLVILIVPMVVGR